MKPIWEYLYHMGDLYPTNDVDNVVKDNDIVFFISSHSVFDTRLFHFAIVSVHNLVA